MTLEDLDKRVLIVGAGCFGISTAYHLLKRGFTSVTVIDRSAVLPAPDAASNDINRMIRASYSDVFYSKLARQAIEAWKDQEEWPDVYHESGVFMMGSDGYSYTDTAYINDLSLGARVTKFSDAEAVKAVFPKGVKTGLSSGFINRDGGWVDAAKSVSLMMSKVIAMGGQVMPGKDVSRLIKENGKAAGVECVDGTVMRADLVIVATGAWTACNFPELELGEKCLATGQSVAFLQLTPEEGAIYRNCPSLLNYQSGFYCFPPNDDNVMKMGHHSGGYVNVLPNINSQVPISVPRTSYSHGEEGLRIPRAMLHVIRAHLRAAYPELADKPFSKTRLCWYTDTPDEDWVIGFYPGDTGLLVATGGSGHAFKFLPVIGGLVADVVTGKLEYALRDKFGVDRAYKAHDTTRYPWKVEALQVVDLCSAEDLGSTSTGSV